MSLSFSLKGGEVVDSSEKKLIKLCKQQNKDALHTIYTKYEKYIYSICHNYTHSKEDALDLLHDIFIKMMKGLERFDENRPLLPWIKRITINTCINHKRKKKSSVSLDEIMTEDGQTLKDAIASQFNLENYILFQDTTHIINEEIAKIDDRYRLPLILKHLHHMSYEEIANYMDIPLGTVKTNLFRGRKQLKLNLELRGLWG